MARYTGPKRKLERRENFPLFGTNKYQKRAGNPGQHPMSRGRSSEYAVQIREKQKVKRIYGVLERQFSKIVTQALKAEGNSGTRLMQLLEARLDNVVFRSGFSKTRMQSRQFVAHGHVKVNGKLVDIPSYQVAVGDEIELDSKIADNAMGKVIYKELEEYKVPAWIDVKGMTAKVEKIPSRDQLDQAINERLIIEFYSR